METIKEIKMEIGESVNLYIWDEKEKEAKEITEKEFSKLKPKEQIEILLDTIQYLHTALQDDLRSIWKRLDKIEKD
jgi:DNA polymerase III delta subunit